MKTAIATLSYRSNPAVARRTISVPTGPWAMFVAVLGLALIAHLFFPAHVSEALINPMGATAGVAAVAGIRRSAHARAWNLIAAGVAVYVLGDLLGLTSSFLSTARFASASYVIAYAGFAAGFTAFLFSRR